MLHSTPDFWFGTFADDRQCPAHLDTVPKAPFEFFTRAIEHVRVRRVGTVATGPILVFRTGGGGAIEQECVGWVVGIRQLRWVLGEAGGTPGDPASEPSCTARLIQPTTTTGLPETFSAVWPDSEAPTINIPRAAEVRTVLSDFMLPSHSVVLH